MKLLLDTHALVWWDSGELPAAVSQRIQAAEVAFVSAVAAWEIAIKSGLGRIVAKAPVSADKLLRKYKAPVVWD